MSRCSLMKDVLVLELLVGEGWGERPPNMNMLEPIGVDAYAGSAAGSTFNDDEELFRLSMSRSRGLADIAVSSMKR